MRRRFEHELDANYDRLLDLLVSTRAEVRAAFGTSEVRGWIEALDDDLVDLIGEGNLAEATRRLRTHVGLETTTEQPAATKPAGAAA